MYAILEIFCLLYILGWLYLRCLSISMDEMHTTWIRLELIIIGATFVDLCVHLGTEMA